MMTAEQLKNSILQLAMQGKLVEQRQEEGTGRDLLKLIETHFKGTKKLSIDNDELPFEIPVSWVWTKVGNITILYNGRAFKPSDWSDDGLPIVRIQNLNDEHAPYNRYNGSFEEVHHLYGGELLFAWSGTPGTSFGAHIWRKQEAVLNQHIFKVEFPESHLDKKYFALALNFQVLSLIRLAHGSAGLQHVTKGTFQNTLIPIPPLAEQKRIIAKIEELMPLVEQYAAASAKLNTLNASFPEMMKKSILQEAVQGKLVPQDPNDEPASLLLKKIAEEKKRLIKEGKIKKQKPLPEITEDEIPFEIPKSWEWCYINDIAFVTKLAGFEYTKNIAPNLTNKGIPLFKGKNVQNGRLVMEFESFIPESISDELSRSQLDRKCLLTPYVGTIGNIAIFNGEFKAHLGSNVGKIEILNSKQTYVMEEYVLHYLRSPEGYKQLTKYMKATAQESISIDAIRNVIIGIPPLGEQMRIVEKIDRCMSIADTLYE